MPDFNYGQIPQDLLDKNSGNLRDALSGVLPQDVIDRLRNSAASFGVASGLPGSDFSGYRGLTQLGLTSLGRQDDAAKLLNGMYTTPAQQQQLELEKQRMALEEQKRRDALAAAKKPGITTFTGPGGPPGGGGGPGPAHVNNPSGLANPHPGSFNPMDYINKYLPGAGNLGPAGPVSPSFFNPGVTSVDLTPLKYGLNNYGNQYDQGYDQGIVQPNQYGMGNYGNQYDQGGDQGLQNTYDEWDDFMY